MRDGVRGNVINLKKYMSYNKTKVTIPPMMVKSFVPTTP